jgi:hypothetical protein
MDDGDQADFEDASSEPRGLSATAFGMPPDPQPRTPVPPEHQQAVELVAQARHSQREGRSEEAEQRFRRAAELELQVLRSVASQPERGLIAEFGARAALQSGSLELARKLIWKGLSPRTSEPVRWALLLASIQVDLVEFLNEFENGWQVPWEPVDEEESRILVVSRRGRRLAVEIDPDATSASEKALSPEELTFLIPAARPNRMTLSILEASVTSWLRPRPRVQVVSERRGVVEHLLLDPVFV